MFRQPPAWPPAKATAAVPPTRPATAAVTFERSVPTGIGRQRKNVRAVAQVVEVVDYGKGEDDGLVRVKATLLDSLTTRTLTVLAEDVRVGYTPFEVFVASREWFESKRGPADD